MSATANYHVAWDYDSTVLPMVKQFNVYEIDNVTGSPTWGQRLSTTPVVTTITVPTDLAPLVVVLGLGGRVIEVVPMDAAGTEGVPARLSMSSPLPAVTNLHLVSVS
jgi:hypothetical protein